MKFCVTVKQSNIHFITKFSRNTLDDDKIMLFNPRQPQFLRVWASCRTDWTRTDSLRRLSGPQALQIWTHWTVTSRASWKSTINSNWSLRRLMSWKSSCRPLGRAATRTHQQGGSELHQLSDCLHDWLPMVVTPSICSKSVHLQVCILIPSPANWFFSEPTTDYRWIQRSECREMGGVGAVLVETALRFSRIFQPNLV